MAGRFADVKPNRRIGNPAAHRKWRVRIRQLRLHGGWQDDRLKQNREKIDVSDPGCGWNLTIQVSPDRSSMNLVDVAKVNPGNFIAGTAVHQ